MEHTEESSSNAMMPRQSEEKAAKEREVLSPSPDIMTTSKEHSTRTMSPVVPAEEEHGHLTGLKLFATMSSLTVVGFLMLLDISVVSTVS